MLYLSNLTNGSLELVGLGFESFKQTASIPTMVI